MKRLTQERMRIGWSKQRLAQEARISPIYVGQAESGRRMPYPTELKRLCVSLGYSGPAEDLMDEVD